MYGEKLILCGLPFDVVYQLNIICKISMDKQVCNKLKLYSSQYILLLFIYIDYVTVVSQDM
jgi:hypothetical protein